MTSYPPDKCESEDEERQFQAKITTKECHGYRLLIIRIFISSRPGDIFWSTQF
jgi:hypothetical protein